MNTVPVGDGVVRYVFLHGLFGQARNWTSIAKALLPAASLLVDLPNHGRSAWTDRFSYTGMADAVADRLAPLAPVTLVGHSMGGRVAMATALRHPGVVARLVVEDTAPVDLDMTAFTDVAEALAGLDLDRLASRSQARASLAAAIPDERVRDFLLQNLQRDAGGWRWSMNLELLRRDMGAIGAWPAIPGTYAGPVLWITGTGSNRTSPGQAAAMRAYFPAVLHMRVKGAGHWVHADAPGVFVDALREFGA